jgi:hypothetical protein
MKKEPRAKMTAAAKNEELVALGGSYARMNNIQGSAAQGVV